MRLIALLSFLLLSACAKPAPRLIAPPPPPDCFAPGGLYMAFAGLQKHTCEQAPKETIVFGLEIKPNTLTCGLHKQIVRDKNGWVTTTILLASPSGLAGRTMVDTLKCHAIYEVVLLRMR